MTLAAVVLHPHPGMGGDSSHPLVRAIAERLDEGGVAVATPDIGDPDFGRAASDVVHVAADLMATSGSERLVLVGYSWGSIVSSHTHAAGLVGRVLVAPPLSMMGLAADDHLPALVLVPAHDTFGGPDTVAGALEDRDTCVMEVVDGADHFLAGAVDRVAGRVVDWIGAL